MKTGLLKKLDAVLFSENKWATLGFALIVLLISFFTFFHNYHQPDKLFWDENYHLPSAEKYLQGVMFMECHPPLGKLLIALGEAIISPNRQITKTNFTANDYLSDTPPGFSFAGYRFFPALFATWGAVLFFLILLLISKSHLLSLAGSTFYLFDNALIVHFRGAMLDGIQLFFILACLLVFLWSIRHDRKPAWIHYSLLALAAGLAISVKLNSAIILPLFAFMFAHEHKAELIELYHELFSRRGVKKGIRLLLVLLKKSLPRILQSAPVMIAVFCLTFWVHTGLGRRTEPNMTYRASPQYLSIMQEGKTFSPASFPVMLYDNLVYMAHYHEGVPKLDVTKPGENGSHPFTWPLGNKTINYRWDKIGDRVSYIYLVGNPLIWTIGLVGLVLGLALVLGRFIFKAPVTNKRLFNLVLALLFLYACYMFTMISIDRVMYLYHYFIPMQLSLVTAFTVFVYIYEEYIKKKSAWVFVPALVICLLIFKTFLFFSPLTYYGQLTTEQFKARQWSNYWRLEHVE